MLLPLRIMFLSRGPSYSTAIPLQFDVLETRALLSTVVWPGLENAAEQTGANYTLNVAQDLGTLSSSAQTGVVGVVGNGPAGAAEVDWYSFTLTGPSQVTLKTLDRQAGSPFVSVLTLYNNDPNDWNDPFDPLGHRILAQSDGASQGGDASISMTLGAGTYYVAVSGSGNQYFEPFLDGSGYNGSTGAYGLQITTSPTGINPLTDGPAVLSADPTAGSVLSQSPFMIRVDFSAALDPNTINPGQDVQLLWNATGDFGNGQDQSIPIASANFSSAINELQLIPQAPLAPGYYEVVLFGDTAQHGSGSVLADLNGNPLGENSANSQGEDYTYTFRIDGIKGNTSPNPTADNSIATAQQLGNITQTGLVQIAGAIGNNPNDQAFNPNDVDFYNFQINGPGRYALTSEVFAGRVGSLLDAALTLYQWNPTTQSLTLVAVNDNSLNQTLDAQGFSSLFTDPVLFAGLTQGDYYLVVSSGGNVPDPTVNPPWDNGSFNPIIPDSGQNGYSIGNYVLNLDVEQELDAPQVMSVTPTPGSNRFPSPYKKQIKC